MFEEKYTDRVESLKEDGYTLHHTATHRGYVSRIGDTTQRRRMMGILGEDLKSCARIGKVHVIVMSSIGYYR